MSRISRLLPSGGNSEQGNLRNLLIRSAGGTYALKIASTGLQLVAAVLLARWLGVEGYGVFVYAIAWTELLRVPSGLGLDKLQIRNIAAYHSEEQWGLIRGLMRRSNTAVLGASVVLVAITAVAGLGFIPRENQTLQTFWIALLVVPFASLDLLRSSQMQGLHYVVSGQLPELIIRPALFVTFLSTAFVLGRGTFSAPLAAGLFVAAFALTLSVSLLILRHVTPPEIRHAVPEYHTRDWVRSALPLLFVGGAFVVSTKITVLMLGGIKGTDDAGLLSVADRGTWVIGFVAFALNAALAPQLSRLWTAGKGYRLQHIVTQGTRLGFALAVPLAVILIIFGEPLIRLVFGADFVGATRALQITAVTQLMIVASGPAGIMLIMTGHERDAAMAAGGNAVLTVIFDALLIPFFGLTGAAVSGLITVIIYMLWLLLLVRRRTGIAGSVLGSGQPVPAVEEDDE